MAKKQINLTSEAFKVNENGEVVINDAQLANVLNEQNDDDNIGEQGIKVTISI